MLAGNRPALPPCAPARGAAASPAAPAAAGPAAPARGRFPSPVDRVLPEEPRRTASGKKTCFVPLARRASQSRGFGGSPEILQTACRDPLTLELDHRAFLLASAVAEKVQQTAGSDGSAPSAAAAGADF
eukprot:5689202-Pyramimonas_sp.AAC.1